LFFKTVIELFGYISSRKSEINSVFSVSVTDVKHVTYSQ